MIYPFLHVNLISTKGVNVLSFLQKILNACLRIINQLLSGSGITKKTASDLELLLIKHEGVRLKPYRDSLGVLTIGVGRNLTDVGLSAEEASYLFQNDIKTATVGAETFAWFHQLNVPRQHVVINMIFNLGLYRFRLFKKTITYIERGRYSAAANHMLDSLWAKQVGNRAEELARMMRSGEYD